MKSLLFGFSRCYLCQSYHADKMLGLCSLCYEDLPWAIHACRSCGEPIPKNHTEICGTCIQYPPPITRIISATWYQFPIKEMIHQFKFNSIQSNAMLLSTLLSDKIKSNYIHDSKPEALLAVPLSINRLKNRGFNQANLLAKQLGKTLKIPVNLSLIKKTKETATQHSLNQKERMQNLKNAFTISEHSWKHVALIDDIITTNSTMLTLAHLLKKSGVARVDAWSIAKTPKLKDFS
jgi:ComF family protein